MIKFQAIALIRSISPVIEIPSKTGGQPFLKRELVLDDSWTKDGHTYSNYVLVEFTGDRMAQLDNFAPGQRVAVDAFINGRENQGRIFTTLRALSIAPYQAQQPAYVPPQPQYNQAPVPPQAPTHQQGGYAPGAYQQSPYPQQPPYPNQGGYAQAPAPMPGTNAAPNLGPDNLPFR